MIFMNPYCLQFLSTPLCCFFVFFPCCFFNVFFLLSFYFLRTFSICIISLFIFLHFSMVLFSLVLTHHFFYLSKSPGMMIEEPFQRALKLEVFANTIRRDLSDLLHISDISPIQLNITSEALGEEREEDCASSLESLNFLFTYHR